MNYENIAKDLIRALRGERSQTAFSRRLGFRSNVIYAWESGRRFPTAAMTFWAAKRAKVNINEAMQAFFRAPPDWLVTSDLTDFKGIVRLLDELRAGAKIIDLSERSGISRFALTRWYKGQTQPRLPDFLRLVETSSLRLLDFLGALTDPSTLPSVAAQWKKLEASRQVAYRVPWSQAVLRVLELQSYKQLKRHESGFIARTIGISLEEEMRCLDALHNTGQIRYEKEHWVIDRVLTIDTRRDAQAGKALKQWWSEVGLQRLSDGSTGQFSYNLFTVSYKDWNRIQKLHANYYQEMRRIIASSEASQIIVLANLQLIPFGDPRNQDL